MHGKQCEKRGCRGAQRRSFSSSRVSPALTSLSSNLPFVLTHSIMHTAEYPGNQPQENKKSHGCHVSNDNYCVYETMRALVGTQRGSVSRLTEAAGSAGLLTLSLPSYLSYRPRCPQEIPTEAISAHCGRGSERESSSLLQHQRCLRTEGVRTCVCHKHILHEQNRQSRLPSTLHSLTL